MISNRFELGFSTKNKNEKNRYKTFIQTYPSHKAYLDAEFRSNIAETKSRKTSLNGEEETLLNTITGYYKVIQQRLANYKP